MLPDVDLLCLMCTYMLIFILFMFVVLMKPFFIGEMVAAAIVE